MKTETFDNPQEFMRALHGGKRRAGAKAPRKPKGEGTGSRTAALDTLAAAGWTLVGWDYLHDVWFALRHLAERRESATYDGLLDLILAEIRG